MKEEFIPLENEILTEKEVIERSENYYKQINPASGRGGWVIFQGNTHPFCC